MVKHIMAHVEPLSNKELAAIATAIVEETAHRGGNAIMALSPYGHQAKEIVRRNLAKAREQRLRAMCRNREAARFAELKA